MSPTSQNRSNRGYPNVLQPIYGDPVAKGACRGGKERTENRGERDETWCSMNNDVMMSKLPHQLKAAAVARHVGDCDRDVVVGEAVFVAFKPPIWDTTSDRKPPIWDTTSDRKPPILDTTSSTDQNPDSLATK